MCIISYNYVVILNIGIHSYIYLCLLYLIIIIIRNEIRDSIEKKNGKDKKYSTTVFLARPGSISLKVTIPEFIADQLDIRPDDNLVWQVQEGTNSKKKVIIEVSKPLKASTRSLKYMSAGALNLLESILKDHAEDRELYEEFKRLAPMIKRQHLTAKIK
jgi:antitoxin component of MazEF toxin-antitoxin module